jgi:sugar O-acyltransferase (sialic acid O-acetyltransferase NeuD family)
MSKRLLLIGTSGYAKEIAQIARRIDPHRERWHTISYVAASRDEMDTSLLFGRVEYCDDDILAGNVTADAVIALGEPHLRQRVAARFATVRGLTYPNLIDPAVDYDPTLIAMGTGNVIHRNVVMTFNIELGDFNFLNKCAIIGHDAKMGSFNTINPAASVLSNVRMGDGCMVGADATVMPKVKIADRTTLGAKALLRHDVDEPGQVFVGIPAKKLR